MQLTPKQVSEFQGVVWEYFQTHGRRMPWREDPSPYNVLVSEMMLQQTQAQRVIPKFNAFIYTCSSFALLSDKSLSDVLGLWSGLGYNRRAKYLLMTAQIVICEFAGQLPTTIDELIKLPGIGKNTAGAIMAYAYEKPVVFVETNIRTVYFHHFFEGTLEPVSDTQLESLVEQTLDYDNPRRWYWALMDYGSYLKATAGSRVTDSAHYVKQAPLRGSLREMRGRIIKALISGELSQQQLAGIVQADERFRPALSSLEKDEMIEVAGQTVGLTRAKETS